MRSNEATPLSSQATASPSIMQERERRRESASTISGKRWVRSLPGRLYSLTCASVLRAIMRKPSCLISCTHWLPEGSLSVLVGRHGAMNPAGRVRCNMRRQIELGRDDCNSAEPGDKCGVGQLAMTGRPAGRGKPRPALRLTTGRVGAPRVPLDVFSFG